MGVLPGGRSTDTEIFTQLFEGHVPSQPAQAQTQRSNDIEFRSSPDFRCPVGKFLGRPLDYQFGRTRTQPGETVH
jgi:hypothetical protein